MNRPFLSPITVLVISMLALSSVIRPINSLGIRNSDQARPPKFANSSSKMSISPRIVEAVPGDNATVTVTASNVTNLNSWQVVLKYNATVANCSATWVPEDNIFAGETYFAPDPSINEPTVDGFNYAALGCVLLSGGGIDVSYGILFKLNFTILQFGQSRLSIATRQNPVQYGENTWDLLYSVFADPDLIEIPFTEENGDILTGPSAILTIAATAGGTTDPIPDVYTFPANSTVSVTALPESGYEWNHWELDGASVGSENPYNVSMNMNHTLQAVFLVHTPVTWTVDDDGPADFHRIQEAIDSSNVTHGDTIFVKSGTYYEHISVPKNLTLVGENRETTVIDGSGLGVVVEGQLVIDKQVAGEGYNLIGLRSLSEFTIRNGEYGVQVRNVSPLPVGAKPQSTILPCVVEGNRIVDNRYGAVCLGYEPYGCSNVTLSNNFIANNAVFGIHVWNAVDNIVTNNTVVNNGHGIDFYGRSYGNILRQNNMADNKYNFGIILRGEGQYYLSGPESWLMNDVDTSNTVNGKPIYYWMNQRDAQVPSNAGYVLLLNCSNVTIRSCSLTDNIEGILLFRTNNTLVLDNTVASNVYGIYVALWSSNNTLVGNTVANNLHGVYLGEFSRHTTMRDNQISGGAMNFGIYPRVPLRWGQSEFVNDIDRSDLANDVDASNTVDGKPIIYWINQRDRQVPANAGYVMVINSTNILIEGLNLTDNVQNILVFASNNTVIANNSIANSICGVEVKDFSYWLDASGTTKANHPSLNTTIAGNTLTDNGIGIRLWSANNSTTSNNTLCRNPLGILLRGTSDSIVAGNVVVASDMRSSNTGIPYFLQVFNYPEPKWEWSQELMQVEIGGIIIGGSHNMIFENTIRDSAWGISTLDYVYSYFGNDNTIFHNNLINNSPYQALESPRDFNRWDRGYPSGGNYWSDYRGADNFRGENQSMSEPDLIGDEYYDIIAYPADPAHDRYPLIYPYGYVASTDVDGNGVVNVVDVAIVAKSFRSKPGDSNWNSLVDMDINEVINIVDVVKVAHTSLPLPEVHVGVKTGDWIKYNFTISGAPTGISVPAWLKVEFQAVEDTKVTAMVTMHWSSGTEENQTVALDVGSGGGAFGTVSGLVIPANLTTLDPICLSGLGYTMIAGETTIIYAAANRTVLYTSYETTLDLGFSKYEVQATYNWDKQTGILVESSATSTDIVATLEAIDTNMW